MTMKNGAFRAACLAGAAICANVWTAQAAAQTETVIAYDLPAQKLDERLRAIARLSTQEIIFASDTVQGHRAAPLRGRYTVEAAIRASLAQTGMVAEFRDGVLRIREANSPRSQAAGDAAEDMVTVTGTRIRGAGAASPVIVTTRGELEEAGVTDLTGFARLLPQNFTGGQNPGIAGGGQQGGQNNVNNSTTLNLRGLGPDATLTLVNGHRLAYDALNQGVDLSSIPLSAIERVEVIADGASALYGSDAVGGVANIILRRDFDGFETRARAGASTEGGNFQQQFSAVGGGRWSSGGFMIATDYLQTTPIVAGQRDYTSSLDPGATLISGLSQLSIIGAGHQHIIGGISLEWDGQFSSRHSRKSIPFLVTTSVFGNGLYNRPRVDSFAFTPTLRVALPAGWEARASLTHAYSQTDLFSRRYTNGVELKQFLIYENRFNSLEATAEGPLFSLPGGSARLALGGGLRSVVLDVNVSQQVAGLRRATRDFTESRDIQFAYGELSLPLIGPDNHVPLIERLSLSGAVRYERYTGIDEVATPKLGLIYQPHEDVTIRFAWGRSFKVPTLNQVNQARVGNLLPGNTFLPQPVPPLPANATVVQLSGGNPDLRAERATTWTAGIAFRPHFIPGLRLEATWFDVDYRDRISSPFSGTSTALSNPAYRQFVTFNPTPSQILALVATLPLGLANQTGQPFDASRVAAIVDATLQNVASERARGLDLEVGYRLDLAGGALDLTGQASYLRSERQISFGQATLQRAGILFNPPHWHWRGGGSWSRSNAGISLFLNYVGPTIDNRLPSIVEIDDFVTLDASFRLRSAAKSGLLRNVELRLSALNLLDNKPARVSDPDPASPTYDSINQSPVGRFISLSITKSW
jgi:iron complex outermembrane receptor protein